MATTGELLNIEPLELKFAFELKKQISCSLKLSNKTDQYVAFKLLKKISTKDIRATSGLVIHNFLYVKVKTTNPKNYYVCPNTGIVKPHSTCDVIVTKQAQKEAPPDMQCKDKFLLQSVKVPGFNKEAGHVVEECKFRVVYASPPQPPSPVAEGHPPRARASRSSASAISIPASFPLKQVPSHLTEPLLGRRQKNNGIVEVIGNWLYDVWRGRTWRTSLTRYVRLRAED